MQSDGREKARASNARWRAKNPDYFKKWCAKNKERKQQYDHEYYKRPEVKARNNAASRKWYRANKEIRKQWEEKRKADPNYSDMIRDFSLKTKYGITLQCKREMMARQNNLCAIPSCGYSFKNISDANVDHCHNTGKIRGLLCGHCNRAAGLLRDDPKLMRELAWYIEATPNGAL